MKPPPRRTAGGRGQVARIAQDESSDDGEERTLVRPAVRSVRSDISAPKSILKQPKIFEPLQIDSEEESDEDNDALDLTVSSRAAKAGIADDDAEIAALERKLGLKGNKSKALQEDGLDWAAGEAGSSSESEGHTRKRKRPEDTSWLRDKRLKAGGTPLQADTTHGASSESEGQSDDDAAMENPFSDDEVDDEDFDHLDSGSDQAEPPRKQRENPYVAPVTAQDTVTTKYIPPSMRKPAASDEEALQRLQRQTKGLLNRLSEANLLSILQSFEEMYTKNARQHVTGTLVELLVGLICDPAILSDTFLILHAGLAEATYKVVGTDFGAQLLEKVAESIDRFRTSKHEDGKQALNLLAFLCDLYNFQLVGSAMLFDYIRLLLEELTETSTELLLRIVRTSGQQLRQADPSALKDIVLLMQRSVAGKGEDRLSVRTKFMMETINDLKNNRMKTGAAGTTLAAEHTTHMKKIIGTLSSTRSLKATEPLRISLADIRDTEKKGKWWLVGASYHDPSKLASNTKGAASGVSEAAHAAADAAYESDTPGSVNLSRLAREQGMFTDGRRHSLIYIARYDALTALAPPSKLMMCSGCLDPLLINVRYCF